MIEWRPEDPEISVPHQQSSGRRASSWSHAVHCDATRLFVEINQNELWAPTPAPLWVGRIQSPPHPAAGSRGRAAGSVGQKTPGPGWGWGRMQGAPAVFSIPWPASRTLGQRPLGEAASCSLDPPPCPGRGSVKNLLFGGRGRVPAWARTHGLVAAPQRPCSDQACCSEGLPGPGRWRWDQLCLGSRLREVSDLSSSRREAELGFEPRSRTPSLQPPAPPPPSHHSLLWSSGLVVCPKEKNQARTSACPQEAPLGQVHLLTSPGAAGLCCPAAWAGVGWVVPSLQPGSAGEAGGRGWPTSPLSSPSAFLR